MKTMQSQTTAFDDAPSQRTRQNNCETTSERGFTLVELVITITIASILMSIAIPSFRNLTLTNKLSTSANDLIFVITAARMEAIKRNATISVCQDTTCTVETSASVKIRDGIAGITDPIQIQNVQHLIFDGQGLARASSGASPYSGLVAEIFTTELSSNNHRCIYMTTGSVVRSCTITGACPNAEPVSCTE